MLSRRVLALLVGLLVVGGALYWKWRPTSEGDDRAAAAVGLSATEWANAAPADRAALFSGVTLLKAGRPEAALRAFEGITQKDDGPVHLRAVVLSARCFLAGGQVVQARTLFEYVTHKNPSDADAHRGLAAIAYDLGDATAAEFHCRRAAELAPADPGPWRLLAAQALDLKYFDVAEEALKEALTRCAPADRAAIQSDLAVTFTGQKRFTEALAELPPPTTPAQYALQAECLRSLGRTDEAAQAVAAGLALNPDEANLWMERGLLAVATGEDAAAVPAFERTAALDPLHKAALYQLALACRRLGREAEAATHDAAFKTLETRLDRISALTTTAIERPLDPVPRRALAEEWRTLGRPNLAEHWDRAAAACPPSTPPS